MSQLPAPTYVAATTTLNRYGKVRFSSDRPDLQGAFVQIVMSSDGRVVIYSQAWQGQPPTALHEMVGATVTYERESRQIQRTPTWATVLAIVGFFIVFVFSLLFLLVKETKTVDDGLTARIVDRSGRTLLVSIQ